ncbi:hypothetical protein BH20BAC1_BH20BAC1_05650 [soil metagenome]
MNDKALHANLLIEYSKTPKITGKTFLCQFTVTPEKET